MSGKILPEMGDDCDFRKKTSGDGGRTEMSGRRLPEMGDVCDIRKKTCGDGG